jgi:general stress protein 26
VPQTDNGPKAAPRAREHAARRRIVVNSPSVSAFGHLAFRFPLSAFRFPFPMTRPTPEPVDPAKVTDLALEVIRADRFPNLATLDGDQPRVRPVSPVRTDGFTVYVANLRFYHKTGEIEANPKVELCYLDEHHNQVRLTGVAEIVAERPLLEEIWDANPLMRQYLGSLDNPDLIVYRIRPAQVRYMREWALEYFDVPLTSIPG